MQPLQTCTPRALPWGFILAMPARGLPAATNGLSCASVLMHFLHYFLLLHHIRPAQKKSQGFKCSHAEHVPRAACLAASSSQCPARSHSSYHERAIMRVHFIASSALFSAPSTHPSATNKRRGFKCRRSKHAHRGLPCGLNLAGHGRRTSVNADGRP